jgi:hypothetical protein
MAQESFFEIDQLIGGAVFFNVPYAYRLSGPLNVLALRRSLQELVRRHDSLRTVFADPDDRPVQIILERQRIAFSLADLSGLEADKREEALKRISKADAEERFNLRTGPLMRAKLVRLQAHEHILLVTMHHIVTDQWSMGVLRRDLAGIYGAFVDGRLSFPGKPALQFGDFAVWQRRLLDSGMFESHSRYWKMQLAEPLSKIAFDAAAPGARAVGSGSSHQRIEMDSTLFASVQEFARRVQCTPFMVFVTALMMLLHLFTEEQDIRIATLVANRGQPGTEGILGYLANIVILRNIVRSDMPGARLLASVRDVCLAAYSHQDVPYEQVERIVQGEGKRTMPPLAQVMFNFRNFPIAPQQVGGLTIASWNGQSRLSNQGLLMSYIDLAIHLRDASTKLTGAVNYKTDVFSAVAVAGMMRAFRAILSEIVVRPATPVGEYSSFIGSEPGS